MKNFSFYFILFDLEQKFEWGQNFNKNLIERVCNLDNAFYKNLIPAGAYKTWFNATKGNWVS